MSYKLKTGFPDIAITDGDCKGQEFKRGKIYNVIPDVYKDRFETVVVETETVEDKTK